MGGETFENMVKKVMPSDMRERSDNLISYYDLLGMIKERNNPKEVKCGDTVFKWCECSYFDKKGRHLNGNLTDIGALMECIEIIESKKIEKLDMPKQQVTIANDYSKDNIQCIINEFYRRFSVLINKTNEIIEVLNEKEKIQNNQKQ